MIPPKLESVGAENDDRLRAPLADPPGERPLSLVAEAVLDDNEELMKEVAGLKWLCVALTTGSQAGPFDLVKRLEEFEEALLVHFASEEAEEFLGTLLTDQPSLLQRADAVQAEHTEILLVLDDLLDSAQGSSPPPELARRLVGFLEQLDAHEHAEASLMRDLLLLEEEGSSD